MSPSCRGASKYLLSNIDYLNRANKSQKRFVHFSKFFFTNKRTIMSTTTISDQTTIERSPEILEEVCKCYNRLDLSFENHKEAFKSKTNSDLIRSLFVFQMFSFPILVQKSQTILQVMRKILGRTLFKILLKATIYGHFVAGETQTEAQPTVLKLQKFGVKSILDYSVESDITQEEAEKKAVEGIVGKEDVVEAITCQPFVDKEVVDITHQRYTVHKEFGDRRVDVVSARTYFYADEHECDKNVEIFCNSIDAVAEATDGRGFTAIKLTALGRPQLLLKLSETIAQTQNFFLAMTGSSYENLVLSRINESNFLHRLEELGIKTDSGIVKDWFKIVDFDADGFVDFYDWGYLLDNNSDISSMFQVLNIKTGKLESLITNLSKSEQQECSNMMNRLLKIADYAAKREIRIMIDAEQTYFQPAISRLTLALMRKYNKNKGQILNTYQAYLKSALNSMNIDMHLARREGFHFGCKLVRGAYIDQERKRAKAIGYEDPTNENFEQTTLMYHRCLERIVDEWEQRGASGVSVMVASHNEATIRYAVQLMKNRLISPSERVICFAQLYGMCDQVSFSLGQAGYSVYKYLPYGPVEEVLPYLSRRAHENVSILSNLKKEQRLLWSELKRRVLSGQLYHPVI